MGNLFCGGYKPDKKYIIAFIITLFCAIICGIVLYKPIINSYYFRNYAEEYVFNVYNFKNSKLLFAHLLSSLIYFYAIFFIAYFTPLKYLSLVFVFLKGLFFGVYFVVLLFINSFGGAVVAVFVFLPSAIVALAFCFASTEFCKIINEPYSLLFPLALALADMIIYSLLINALFRVIIVIV